MSDLARIPRRNFRAYRRKAPEGNVWIVVESYFYEIDDNLDQIWRAIDGKRTVGEIARAALGDAADAVEQTTQVLDQFAELDIIEWVS